MKPAFLILTLIALVSSPAWSCEKRAALPSPQAKVQIALLLDTSSSMDGLIGQARTRLWTLVNQMATAKCNGQAPTIEVALFEYGKSSLSAESGYISMCLPLTTDLDRVSEELFKLNTNGGDEYCGFVIGEATDKLSWSPNPKDFKAIFIAGNEPFDQGPVKFEERCAQAIAKGIVVNTIFCGDRNEGINTFWKKGADLTDGAFMTIDQNQAAPTVIAPQDEQILALNAKLNQTYVAYGSKGKEAKKRQEVQDQNMVEESSAVMVDRAVVKSSKAYKSDDWDLVSAAASGAVNVADVAPESLPEPLQQMDVKEREAFVAKQSKDREDVQKQIGALQKQREVFLSQQKAPETETLDVAMRKVILAQMKAKNFSFEK